MNDQVVVGDFQGFNLYVWRICSKNQYSACAVFVQLSHTSWYSVSKFRVARIFTSCVLILRQVSLQFTLWVHKTDEVLAKFETQSVVGCGDSIPHRVEFMVAGKGQSDGQGRGRECRGLFCLSAST